VLVVPPVATGSIEGLTVGPDTNIYVPTFGFNTTGALTGNAVLFVISPNGEIVRNVPMPTLPDIGESAHALACFQNEHQRLVASLAFSQDGRWLFPGD
jgi:hypothetical protein